jgi:hypothetical protein
MLGALTTDHMHSSRFLKQASPTTDCPTFTVHFCLVCFVCA